MTGERTRPTRDETRTRLLHAAAQVFARRGIAAATVEEISRAAGFTRGAFYSNFRSKDALVDEMIDEHLGQSILWFEALADEPSVPDLLARITTPREAADTAIARSGIHFTHYVIHAAEREGGRRRLRDRLARSRETIATALERGAHAFGVELPMPAELAADLLLAFDDGFGLHMVIDPDDHTVDRYNAILLHLLGGWAGGGR